MLYKALKNTVLNSPPYIEAQQHELKALKMTTLITENPNQAITKSGVTRNTLP